MTEEQIEEKISEMRVHCTKYILLVARTYHTIHQTITFELYWGKKKGGCKEEAQRSAYLSEAGW